MTPVLNAACDMLETLIADLLHALDGIPDEDLATWKPSAEGNGGGEMNTLAALGVHTALAGQWMLFHQVFGDDVERDREAEFHAVATRAGLDEIFASWLRRFRTRIDAGEELDLSAMPPTIRQGREAWTRLHWLLHMIDHTGLHLGHAQIHRQLWLAERNRPQ